MPVYWKKGGKETPRVKPITIFIAPNQSTAQKRYEEFIQQGMEEEGILYLRGRVSRIFRDGEKVVVWGVDTLTGQKVEVSADMVVLASEVIRGTRTDCKIGISFATPNISAKDPALRDRWFTSLGNISGSFDFIDLPNSTVTGSGYVRCVPVRV
jgi:hypothetical protein